MGIPFASNFNLLSVDFQSRLIQHLEGSCEHSMCRIILKHVGLKEETIQIKEGSYLFIMIENH